jgi:hypothetical protein
MKLAARTEFILALCKHPKVIAVFRPYDNRRRSSVRGLLSRRFALLLALDVSTATHRDAETQDHESR